MNKLTAVLFCLALLMGMGGLADIAQAQTGEVEVLVGTGVIMHRSGGTLIVDVKEGPKGPGMRKFNLQDLEGLHFKNRLGEYVEVFDLKEGNSITVYRWESRPAPVVVTYSEVEEIKKAEPAAPKSKPAPAPAAAPAPAPMLPKTGSSMPLILMLGLVILSAGVALTAIRKLS